MAKSTKGCSPFYERETTDWSEGWSPFNAFSLYASWKTSCKTGYSCAILRGDGRECTDIVTGMALRKRKSYSTEWYVQLTDVMAVNACGHNLPPTQSVQGTQDCGRCLLPANGLICIMPSGVSYRFVQAKTSFFTNSFFAENWMYLFAACEAHVYCKWEIVSTCAACICVSLRGLWNV